MMKVLRRRTHPRYRNHAAGRSNRESVAPEDQLFIPNRKRLRHDWIEEGDERHLYLYYGVAGVCFEQPDELGFGEHLLKAKNFCAKDAAAWFGEESSWNEVKGVLDTLLAEGILRRVDDSPQPRSEQSKVLSPTTEEAVTPRAARTWSMADGMCSTLTAELTGLPIEIGHLEVIFPVDRIAHPALDTDGRQVGEREVIPRFMYLDLPTELQSCPYSGSRYQDDMPMNVTALKLMMKHWEHALALIAQLRDRVAARTGRTGPRWRVGDLQVFAVTTLAASAYLLVRGERPVPNGELPAPIATLFRVVDGVRIVTLTLLLDPDQTCTFDTEITADDVFEYTEKLALFLGPHGVCSGPNARVRQFLNVLMNDAPAPASTGPSLEELLGDVETMIDYAAAATQIKCVVHTFLDRQHAAVSRLLESVRSDDAQGAASSAFTAALERAHSAPAPLRTSRSLSFHASLFEEMGRYWKPRSPFFEGTLMSVLGGLPSHDPARTANLHRFLPGLPEDAAAVVDAYFAEERATLAVVREQVKVLNDLIQRPHPKQPLTGEELQGAGRLIGADLGAALAGVFGLTLERDAATTRLVGSSGDVVLRG